MLVAVVISFIALGLISMLSNTPLEVAGQMGNREIFLWLLAFFMLSFAIAIVSVIAGIGGGVIFTPVMLAFTNVDSMVVRATGLIVAMFSGLMATGIFMKKGLGNFKMNITLVVSMGLGALLGAQAAVVLAQNTGDVGEGILRISLGILLVFIAFYMLTGGKKREFPNVLSSDKFTKWLKIDENRYYEESERRMITYKLTKMAYGLVSVLFVGFLGGFFGMGAGWALAPIQNFVLGAPLKVATANSGVILGMVDCVAIWPYILSGALVPLFVLPWLSGQVVGGYLGASLLVKVKVNVVRIILIGIMVFISFGLVVDGLATLNMIPRIPGSVSLAVFLIIMLANAAYIWSIRKETI